MNSLIIQQTQTHLVGELILKSEREDFDIDPGPTRPLNQETAQAAIDKIVELAKQSSKKSNELIGELIEFIRNKGYERIKCNKVKPTKFYNEYLANTDVNEKYFYFLHDVAEFMLNHNIDFTGDNCKVVRAVCAAGKKKRDQIWSHSVEQSDSDIPEFAIVKQLVEQSKTRSNAKESETSSANLGDELVKGSKNVDRIFCSIAEMSNENQCAFLEKVDDMIKARNNDETGLYQLSLEELDMLSKKLSDQILN